MDIATITKIIAVAEQPKTEPEPTTVADRRSQGAKKAWATRRQNGWVHPKRRTTSVAPNPQKEIVSCYEWGPNAEANDFQDAEAIAITKNWVDDHSVRKFLKSQFPFTFTLTLRGAKKQVEKLCKALGAPMLDICEIPEACFVEAMTFDRYRRCVQRNGFSNGHIRFALSAKWDYYPASHGTKEYIFYFKTKADMILANPAL